MKFEDIKFKSRFPEADCETIKQAIVTFPNEYGASILLGSMFYSNGIDTFELGITYKGSLVYDTPITSNILGYLTQDELMDYLQQIENLPLKENT